MDDLTREYERLVNELVGAVGCAAQQYATSTDDEREEAARAALDAFVHGLIEHHSTPDSTEAGDTARLDWLEDMRHRLSHSLPDQNGARDFVAVVEGADGRSRVYRSHDPRKAIDAAMSAPDTARTPEVSDG